MKLSPKARAVGLFVYCNACKGEPKNEICRRSKVKCPHSDRHVFKVRIHIAGTSKRKRTQVLSTRDPIEAARQASALNLKLKQSIAPPRSQPVKDLITGFLMFVDQPTKNRRPISKDTRADYKLHLEAFERILSENRINVNKIRPNTINVRMAQLLFDSIQYGGRTKKKYFGTYRTFHNYLTKEVGLQLPPNPFNGWNFEAPELENRVISKTEFNKLLDTIDSAPRLNEIGRSMYLPWLKDAFRFGLYSGARRQEIPLVRWSDIIIKGNKPVVILLRDIKNTQIQKRSTEIIKPVRVNLDMAELLEEMGLSENKGSEDYLFEPAMTRLVVKNHLSRSFGYYAKQAGLDLQFKCLRKTWFTRHAAVLGADASAMLGGHAGSEVTRTHYINKLESVSYTERVERIFE